MPQTFTVKQVADILGYSTNSIYTFLKEKRIKGVRVGKGRFRIPQAELDRLLRVEKKPSQKYISQEVVLAPAQQRTIDVGVRVNASWVEVPSLFDWFIGISSIVVGCALFLPFLRFLEDIVIKNYVVWLFPIKISLIAAGVGLLLTDMKDALKSNWRNIFYLVLIAAYGGISGIFGLTQDYPGILLFGTTATVLILVLTKLISNMFSVTLLLSALFAVLPMSIAWSPNLDSWGITINMSHRILFSGAWMLLSATYLLAVYWSYRVRRFVYWCLLVIASASFIVVSFWYAKNTAWVKAFFLLVMGLTSLLIPTWETLTFSHKNHRKAVFGLFSAVLLLFLFSITILGVLQKNLFDYATERLKNTALSGKSLVSSTIESAQSALESAATNTLLINSINDEKSDSLVGFSRSLFENSGKFRRVTFLSGDGDILAVYPLTTSLLGINIGNRDDVLQSSTTRKTYTSNVFEVDIDGYKQATVSIATPIIQNKKIIGTLVGILDIDELGASMQQLAGRDEYFVVADRNNRRIIDPKRELVNSDLEAWHTLRGDFTEKQGIAWGYGAHGESMIQAYTLLDTIGWKILINTPMTAILETTQVASLTIMIITILSILFMVFFLYLLRTHKIPISDSS